MKRLSAAASPELARVRVDECHSCARRSLIVGNAALTEDVLLASRQ